MAGRNGQKISNAYSSIRMERKSLDFGDIRAGRLEYDSAGGGI